MIYLETKENVFKEPIVKIKQFQGLELHYVKINNENWLLAKYVCIALKIPRSHIHKIPKEFISLSPVKTKSGVVRDTYLTNKEGIKYLCSLVEISEDFIKWVDDEIFHITDAQCIQNIEPNIDVLSFENDRYAQFNFANDLLSLLNKYNVSIEKQKDLIFYSMNLFNKIM